MWSAGELTHDSARCHDPSLARAHADTQPLSHFSEGSTVAGNASFAQRVCIVDRYWKAPSAAVGAATHAHGPILFYTGNESPIDEYANSGPRPPS